MYTGTATIALRVRDASVSFEYYQRVLGFVFRGYGDPENGRMVIERPNAPSFVELLAGDNPVRLYTGNGGGQSGAEFRLDVVDLEVMHRRATAGGAEPTQPRNLPEGGRAFEVTDPDGYRWTVLQR